MTESSQSHSAPERACYIATAENMLHFCHIGCPKPPIYWSVSDRSAGRAYYCPYCGVRLAPPEVTA